MTEPYNGDPDDEPVIGANYPPPPPRPGAPVPPPFDDGVIGGYDASDDEWDDDEYADDEELEEEEPYIDEVPYYTAARGYERPPARQPLFYAFVALALLIGAGAVYLLYTVVANSGDDKGPTTTPTATTTLLTEITSPRDGDRFKTNEQVDFVANASSNTPIEKFQLLVNDKVVDEVPATLTTGTLYSGTLHTRFDTRGDYKAYVRVFTTGGAVTRDTAKITLTVIEEDTQSPASVKGKVVAEVNLRTGPSETFDRAGSLNVGDEVTITGRNADSSWLFVDTQGGLWVKHSAVEEEASIAGVPVKDSGTPTVSPTTTGTTTVTPTPSVTPTPTQEAGLPDFVPNNAVLIDGGSRLRVTVANISTNAFNGTLVVSASGVSADPSSKAFAANIGANQATTVDFDLDTPVTQQVTVQVQVDPDNAINEQNEDNNGASIVLQPPAEAPALSITGAQVLQTSINVTVSNSGGSLKGTAVTIRLTFGQTTLSTPATIALEKGQSVTVSITRPAGTGPATVSLLINEQEAAAPYDFSIQ